MDIALHIGAHLTDDGRLLRCLVKNRETLFPQNIEVPGPGRYREALIHMAAAEAPLSPEAGQVLLDECLDSDESTRLVLSEANVLGWKSGAVRGDVLYGNAASRLANLRGAFAGHDVELFLAIRNPASFLPALLAHLKPPAAAALRAARPQTLRWAPMIASLRRAWPEARLTVWCDEDTPFIWHRVLRAVSGHDAPEDLAHSYDWFEQIMVEGGAQKLERYLTTTPILDEGHRQRVIAAFLDKFMDADKVEVDVSLPEWDETVLDLLSGLYDEDVDTISASTDIRFIQP